MLAVADTLAVDVSGAQALKAGAAAGDKDALRKAARQFESLMVGMMLKSMRATKFSDEDDPLTSGEGVKLYRDLLDQQWADKLSKGRGLGFADMIVKSLEKFAPPPAGEGPGVREPGVGQQQRLLPLPSPLPEGEGARRDQAPAPVEARSLSPTPPPEGEGLKKKRAFLETLRPHAEAAAASTGVPADYILAHAALESGWGKREITAADGSPSHNLFGIKAGGNWRGAAVETQTTEYRQGMPLKMTQQFRAYADYGAAFSDYAGLLKARYGAALESNDAGGFAEGLAAGGYASDPAYAGKLKSVIASVAMAGG